MAKFAKIYHQFYLLIDTHNYQKKAHDSVGFFESECLAKLLIAIKSSVSQLQIEECLFFQNHINMWNIVF